MRKLTDSKGNPYSTTYLKTIHNQMSAIFNHAVRYYGLGSNPAAKAGSMGEKEAAEMDFWTKEEFLKVIDAMMDSPIHYYSYVSFPDLSWSALSSIISSYTENMPAIFVDFVYLRNQLPLLYYNYNCHNLRYP